MYSSSGARKSFDSLSSPLSTGPRGELPFHSPGRASTRRGSTASSIRSVGGSLDTGPGSWANTVIESGQNAISTLLQPPIVRTGLVPHAAAPASSAHKPPTARDIPPVTLTNIPHVDTSEFEPYLLQVGALYEQLRRVKEDEHGAAGGGGAGGRNSKTDEGITLLDEGQLQLGRRRPGQMSRKMSTSSIASIVSLESNVSGRLSRTTSGYKRAATHGPPPLSTIPAVYFDQDFRLENPRTFDVVSERSEVVRQVNPGSDDKTVSNGQVPAPRKALATNAILQEKLSWYMDTVEMHLIQCISTASTTFFTALGSLRELHSEAAESVERVKVLRKQLEALDQEIATSGLTIVQQRRRRRNVHQLHDAVLQLRDIVRGVAVCESLVDSGDVEEALDRIESLEMLMAGEEDHASLGQGCSGGRPRRDLRGAVALQGVSSDLETLRLRVGRDYESRFIALVMGDLRNHVETVSSPEVLMRWSSASMRGRGSHQREHSAHPAYLSGTDRLRSNLLTTLTGLQRARHLTAATLAYRDGVLREIRSIVKRCLPSSNEEDATSVMSSSTATGGRTLSEQDRSKSLARNLRAMSPRDAEELLVKIYVGVTESLRRLNTQVKVLLDVAYSIGDPVGLAGLKSPALKSPPASPSQQNPSAEALEAQEEIHKALDLTSLLGQAIDVAQDKVVRLLRVRSEQSTHFSLIAFLRYFALNLGFANECEAISGRSGTTLKTVVNCHIKDYIQHHGDTEQRKLAQGMDSDLWNAADFTEDDSRLLNQILESSTHDVLEWKEAARIWIPHLEAVGDGDGEKLGCRATQKTNGTGKPKTRSAIVESENFMIPNSAISCMRGMAQFMQLMAGIPGLAAEISSSLIAYLQLFNSRCTQLILGAGATRSAGLKNITTRNLALASQALSFMATIMPHVREFVRRQCGSGAAVSPVMGEFDKVRRLYQEHQNSIYDKLVEIMSGRAQVLCKKMRDMDWDAPGGPEVHDYIEALSKDTVTLYKVLTKHLPEGIISMITQSVFRNYAETLGVAFRSVHPETEAGRQSMLRDVEHFQSRLGGIEGFGDAGEQLIKIVKEKEIRSATGPPAAESPTPQPPNGRETNKETEPDVAEASDENGDADGESGESADRGGS